MAITNDGNGASLVMVVRVAKSGEGRKKREVKRERKESGKKKEARVSHIRALLMDY